VLASVVYVGVALVLGAVPRELLSEVRLPGRSRAGN
jgi:hypothetical protein